MRNHGAWPLITYSHLRYTIKVWDVARSEFMFRASCPLFASDDEARAHAERAFQYKCWIIAPVRPEMMRQHIRDQHD